MQRRLISGRWALPGLLLTLIAGLAVYWDQFQRPGNEAQEPGIRLPKPMLGKSVEAVKETPADADSQSVQPASSPNADSSAARPSEERQTAAGGHPSEPLIAGSTLVREQWSAADALGNRERAAIYRTDAFKYRNLRVVEKWSGKTGGMVSRFVMLADHLLVGSRAGIAAAELEKRVAEQGFAVVEKVGESSMLLSFTTAMEDPEELPRRIEALSAMKDVVGFSEPDYIVWPCVVPNDAAFAGNKLWGLRNLGGVSGYTAGADIDASAAWDVRNDASGVIVAVTDTGIRHDHQDLAPNMWRNPAETAGDGIDNDRNGVVDDVFGMDAYDDDGNPMDTQGHGTHCAGTIGARGNNGLGMTGVVWNVQLMAGRFLGANGGTTSDGIRVIDYARQKGAHVISASWGGGGFSVALGNAIAACANAGIPFVAAAGNSGTDNDSLPHYPASYDLPNIVAVAATNADDELTGFSCYGFNSVDIAAPGWQIWSSYSGSTSDYRFLQGTSMATPHVSGALALARAQFPSAGVEELIGGLYQSADKLASLEGRVSTGGRLNLRRLLTEIAPPVPNDSFDSPFVLAGDHATWSGSNRAATRELDESSYSPAAGSRTLWFAWQAPFDGFASLSASSLGAGQRLVVFSGSSRETLRIVHDTGIISGSLSDTAARFVATAGTQYRIVTASNSLNGELFSLNMEIVATNDLLSRAHVIEGESFESPWSNRGATAQPFENAAPHAGVGAGHSVWFRWTAPVSGPFSINTEGSSTDTVVAVYTGDPLDPSGFSVTGANDDVSGMLRWSRVDFNAAAGMTYFIAVDTAMGGVPGTFVLRGDSPATPVIASEPIDLEIPLGGRGLFSVGVAGTPPLRYQWFKNGLALAGAWQNSLVIDPVTADTLATYHVVVSNSFGSITSRNVQLAEKRFAPAIVWSTGDLAVLSGQDAALGVRVSGSEAMSYSWTKDGVPLAGRNQSSLQLSGVTSADKGIYVCTIANDQGTTSATTVLTVVSSPFDSFTAVRESAPNSPIASISVIDGKCYAVASERIMVSEDGRAWTPWYLPGGFDGSAVTKHNGKWYCAGYRVDGKLSMAISNDGLAWADPVEITGFTPPSGGHTPIAKLVSFNGRLVAAQTPVLSSGGIWQGAGIYHSTNGINWTRSQRRNIDTTLVDLTVKCRFEAWGGKLYAPGDNGASSVLITGDGITWQESALPAAVGGTSYGEGKSIGTFGNRLCLVCSGGTYSTSDGINWTMDGGLGDNDGYFGRIVVSTGDKVSSFTTWSGAETYRFGSSPATWRNFIANPRGQIFSAAVEFDGAIVCGTTTGLLRRIESQEDFSGTAEAVFPLSRLQFLNEEFLAYRSISIGSLHPGSILLSGDGRRWRAGKSFSIYADHEERNPAARIFLGGRYLSSNTAGWIPAEMSASTLPAGVAGGSAAATDGTRWLVIGSGQNVYSVSMDGKQWTPIPTTGLNVGSNHSILHFNGKWFVSSYGGGSDTLYQSSDGIAWSQTAGLAAPGPSMVLNQKLCVLNTTGSTLYESADGVTWSSFPTGITVGSTRNVGTTTVTAERLLVFDGKLITLVQESLSRRKFAFFTQDARTWFRGRAPVNLQDLATGKDMLVGITSNGSVLVSGSTGAGGAAPLANIAYPAHKSTHVSGTMVEIRGTAVDPESQTVTTECFVDGSSIGSTTGGTFRFLFRPSNPAGHVVSVRSRDPAGIVGSDEIKIFASPPQLRNDYESEEGKSHLPQVAWTSFGGRAYVAGNYSLYRSRGDGSWESVLLPSLPGAITNLVAGNGTLIVQTSNANFATRDGVVWTQLSSPAGGTIAYRDGWFTARRYDSYWGYTQTGFSQDGLAWTLGSGSNSGGSWSPSIPTVTPGGSLLVVPPYRSIDGGTNWIEMPDFGGANANDLQFATAFGAVFAGLSDGRVLRSSDDGRSWQQVAQFAALPSEHQVRIALHAGRLFWGGGGYWLAGSDDGISWKALEEEPLQSSHVVSFDGRFVGFGRNGMLWSANGYVWQPQKAGPENPVRDMLADDGDALLMGDTDGGVWRAEDGRTWIRVMPGRPVTRAPAVNYSNNAGTRLQVGNTIVFGGSADNSHYNTFLWYTDNDGLDWNAGRFHGGSFSGVAISNMWSNGGVAFAATSRILPESNTFDGLWRSTDGRDWKQLWTWPGGAVADMRFEGDEWWCLGTNGELRRSDNNGTTWSEDLRPAGLLAGRLLIRFDGAWIVIGTEVADLQGPNVVHVSTDGQTWTKHAAPGGEVTWSRLSSAVNVNALVVISNYGKVYTATDRNLNWTNTATLDIIYSGVHQIDAIGGKLCILGKLVSVDGFTWTTPVNVGSTIATPMVYFNGLYVAFQYNLPPLWSNDGLNWTQSTGSGTFGYRPVFAVGSNALRVRLASGAIWETSDGKQWSMARDEMADLSNTGTARRIVSFGGRLLVTGTAGLLLYSDSDGRSWQPGLVNGQQLPPSASEREIKTSPTEAIAIYHVNTNSNPPVCRHFRSQDGRSWTEMPDMAALNVMDYAWDGGIWLAICHNGSLLRSTDGGLTWSPAGSIPNVLRGRRLTRFQGLWVAAGTTTTSGTNPPLQLHTSPDGIEWTNRGDSGSRDLAERTTPPLFFTGHGLLHFGRQPSVNNSAQGPVKCSADGLTWTTLNTGGNTNAPDGSGSRASMFVPLDDGYLAFGSSSSTSYYWKAPATGGNWASIPALQNQIKWVGTPDGQRLFLFGPGMIKEWTAEDLELTIADPEPLVIGVGENLAVDATLRNLGTATMTDPIKVDAWLSTDRFFGDGNDIYVGWDAWAGPTPSPGNELAGELSFTLPNTARPGSHYLIVQLRLPDSFRESNRANNSAITGTTVVTIPQRKLKLKANGEGTVDSEQNAEYYPHGARIALVANPGKGARFAGWGGDALGSLGETLVIMDADKNVEANFVSTAALTVFTRGGGSVQRSVDDGIYLAGSTANLTAVPSPGWSFDGWSGALTSDQAVESLLMDSNKIVTARFSLGLDAWRSQQFSAAELADPAVSGDLADADGDGLETWREWLRGSDPKDRDSRGHGAVRREGNWIVMNYTRLENMPAGHAVRASASSDLNNWSVPIDERVVGSANGVETIEVRVDVTGMPKCFLRTSDTRPGP